MNNACSFISFQFHQILDAISFSVGSLTNMPFLTLSALSKFLESFFFWDAPNTQYFYLFIWNLQNSFLVWFVIATPFFSFLILIIKKQIMTNCF